MPKISCIIPAYNEGGNISNILSVVAPLVGKSLYEIIVVDDMSQDKTKQIVKTFPSVRLIEHTVNEGKSKAVSDGIRQSTGSHIFLLDADLLFLNEKNIVDLIEPIVSDKADLTISYRKNAWPLFPFTDIDYLSGERIFPRKYVTPFIDEIALLSSYGLEVFLNKNIIIRHQLRISVVQWSNVENNFHHSKQGMFRGIKKTVKIWWDVLRTVSIVEMYKQNINLRKLIVK